jgi:N-acetylglucosamine-6-phosphate deacetylase
VLALRGGRVLTSDGWSGQDLLVEGGVVHGAGHADRVLDVSGCVVAPGFVDLHVHAAGGCAVQGSDADLAGVARSLARGGVTSFLATTFTAPEDELRAVLAAVPPEEGARCLGVHLEGPWISRAAAGAQPQEWIRSPDVEAAESLVEAGPLRAVTLAPEQPGALDLVRTLVARGVHVSLGHSQATYDEASLAVEAGARGITHCYNAMSQLTAREPGLVGLALSAPGLVVEVIADGVHVHESAVRALVAARGPAGVALVSDNVDGCAPEGLHRDGDVLRLPDGTLAGSALQLVDAVKRLVAWGIPLEDALAMASTTPASVLGLDVSLRPGATADVVVLGPDLSVRHVLVAGEEQ